MRVVIQRVSSASVNIDNKLYSDINQGLLVLLGIEEKDDQSDIDWLCKKINGLRIFNDSDNFMNLSIQDINGEVLVVSQFTLHASTKKGNRPSFIKSAKPGIAEPLYQQFIGCLQQFIGKPIRTGKFGADMQVTLTNDGPVTILIDSKNKE